MTITNLHEFELGKFIHTMKDGKAPETFDLSVLALDHGHKTRDHTAGNLIYQGPEPSYVKQIPNPKHFFDELKNLYCKIILD